MGCFYLVDDQLVPHLYHQFSYADELRPGGCYPGGDDHVWTPADIGTSDYVDYTLTSGWPDGPYSSSVTRYYAPSDNGGILLMERTTSTSYLNSLGWPTRLIPAGDFIMQKAHGTTGWLQRDNSQYGLFDSCDDVTLVAKRYPQIVYDPIEGESLLASFFMTLDFSNRSINSGANSTLGPFLALTVAQSPVVDDPPASSGLEMTQTIELEYRHKGSAERCYVSIEDYPMLLSTSEWATTETTFTLRLHGSGTQPRKATASVSNEHGSDTVDLVFGENPLCHCSQGCGFRFNQLANGLDRDGGHDYDTAPDNLTSVTLTIA